MSFPNPANKKPRPLYPATSRAICPVCGTTSYSPAGVHPQCAMLAADRAYTERRKAERAVPEPPRALRWHEKPCPRCQVIPRVRRRACECGYVFPTDNGE